MTHVGGPPDNHNDREKVSDDLLSNWDDNLETVGKDIRILKGPPVGDLDDVDPRLKRNLTDIGRQQMASSAILLLVFTIAGAFAVAAWGSQEAWTRVEDLLQIVIPVETLIIGAAVSYYFNHYER